MAATFSEEEREERINLVAEYILETGASYRETADYFSSSSDFEISHVTVKDYCDRYINANSDRGKTLKEIISGNKPKGIEDDEVKNRVLNVAKIYIGTDLEVEELASNLNLSVWTVYRDLTVRLAQIETEEAIKLNRLVLEKLENNSLSNLRGQNGRKN